MSCLWGWMNVGMNMDVWVRGRWRDLGRMEDGTTWKVSGQQHDDEEAWTDGIMIHFLRYPKNWTETKVRKCSNSNCPQLALTSRLHRCQFWNSWDDQQAGPVQLCSIMTGQRVAHPGDHYPPILLVAQHLVSHSGPWHERRFLVTCSLTGEGGGIVPIHECLRYLHCTLLGEKNASWCTCCEHPSTSTFLTNVHRTSCKNQGRFTAYKSLGSVLAGDSCPRKRKRRGKIFVYCKTSFPCPLLLSNLWVCSAIKNQISWWI